MRFSIFPRLSVICVVFLCLCMTHLTPDLVQTVRGCLLCGFLVPASCSSTRASYQATLMSWRRTWRKNLHLSLSLPQVYQISWTQNLQLNPPTRRNLEVGNGKRRLEQETKQQTESAPKIASLNNVPEKDRRPTSGRWNHSSTC